MRSRHTIVTRAATLAAAVGAVVLVNAGVAVAAPTPPTGGDGGTTPVQIVSDHPVQVTPVGPPYVDIDPGDVSPTEPTLPPQVVMPLPPCVLQPDGCGQGTVTFPPVTIIPPSEDPGPSLPPLQVADPSPAAPDPAPGDAAPGDAAPAAGDDALVDQGAPAAATPDEVLGSEAAPAEVAGETSDAGRWTLLAGIGGVLGGLVAGWVLYDVARRRERRDAAA